MLFENNSGISPLNIYRLTDIFLKHLIAFISIMGIMGNILVVCVISRKRFQNITYSIYFLFMAFTDSIILLNNLRHWIRIFLDIDLDLMSIFFCKLNKYFTYIAGLCSLWFITIILVDRFVKITHFNRPTVFKKKSFQICLVIAVFVHCSLMHSVLLVKYQYETTNHVGKNSSSLIQETKCFLPLKYVYLNGLVVFGNTCLLILVNTILYVKLFAFMAKSRVKFRNKRKNKAMHRDLKFVSVSVTITLFMFLSKLSLGFAVLISSYLGLSQEQIDLTFNICATFATLSNASSFPINIKMNSVFYDEFNKMMRSSSENM